ncbi:MAG: radical SAM protein [Gemmatimonadetes bacterium 13_2_20CM_70_9]|nr:MAG: radical SAM protein [Gemmatimonadetes bacterium 13_2_20CM_70_9]
MPLRTDRILRYVVAFCAACHREHPDRPLGLVPRLSGYLAEQDGKVWLVRGCPRHGKVVTLYDEVPEILRYLEEWTAPTKVHTPDTLGNYDPVPAAYLHGLGEMQTQHTCILLEEITEQCNLRCPTCFADSSPQLTGVVPLDQVLENIDRRLAREHGRLDVLMISGGEPTVYPRLLELLERVLERDIVRILINTNGIQITRSDELLDFLTRHNDRIEIYLQFDGFKPETLRHHRNADLRRVKREAVERLSGAGIFTTLTMTAALGVNDDEIGAVVRYGLATPFVGGISIQPQFGSGRSAALDPRNRLTHTGVLARLGPQTDGLVTWRDLTALPCSHPHCCSVGYMLKTDAGEWRSLVAIVGHDRLKQHLELVSNRIADREIPAQLRELVKQSFLGLLSERTSLTDPTVTDLFRNICENCDLGLSTLLRLAGSALLGQRDRMRRFFGERIKRITIKPFMDMDTMLEERLLQCCVHVGTQSDAQHQCAPFCAVQAWPALARQKPAARAGSAARPLELAAPPV